MICDGQIVNKVEEGKLVTIKVNSTSGRNYPIAYVAINGIVYFDKTNSFINLTAEVICENISMIEGGLEIIIMVAPNYGPY